MRTRLCSKCQKPKTREEFRDYWWHRPWGYIIYCRLCKNGGGEMDTAGFKFDKPVGKKRGTRLTKDGRLIESPSQYRETKRRMWGDQFCRCAECNAYIPEPDLGHRHHPGGRGLGGSKRDDSKTVLLCAPCHTKEHQ